MIDLDMTKNAQFYIFNTNGINLIIDIQALYVLAISLYYINEIINTIIITENDLSIVNTILCINSITYSYLMKNLIHCIIRIIPHAC